MATSYNSSELTRTITTLKETNLALKFKLNLLRSPATSSPAHLSTFEGLLDQLIDASSEIWAMEENFKDRESGMGKVLVVDGDDDKVRSALKEADALRATFDALVEDIMRLKFTLGTPQTVISTAPEALVSGHDVRVVSGNISNPPAAKRQKLSPTPKTPKATPAASPVAIKQEDTTPKKPKLAHWAPEEYYYVKAHFRRKPKRKAKNGVNNEGEADNVAKESEASASIDIVDLDGI